MQSYFSVENHGIYRSSIVQPSEELRKKHQPLGKDNQEIVFENENSNVVVYHYWYEHGDPLTAPSYPYSEHYELVAEISDSYTSIKINRDFGENKAAAIELARKIAKKRCRFNIYHNSATSDYITVEFKDNRPCGYCKETGQVPPNSKVCPCCNGNKVIKYSK